MAVVVVSLDSFQESQQHAFQEADVHDRDGAGVTTTEYIQGVLAKEVYVQRTGIPHFLGYYLVLPPEYGTPMETGSDGWPRRYRSCVLTRVDSPSFAWRPDNQVGNSTYAMRVHITKYEGITDIYEGWHCTGGTNAWYGGPYEQVGDWVMDSFTIDDHNCNFVMVGIFRAVFGEEEKIVTVTYSGAYSEGQTMMEVKDEAWALYQAAPALSELGNSGGHSFVYNDSQEVVVGSFYQFGAAPGHWPLDTGFCIGQRSGFEAGAIVRFRGEVYRVNCRDWYLHNKVYNTVGDTVPHTDYPGDWSTGTRQAPHVRTYPDDLFYLEADGGLNGHVPRMGIPVPAKTKTSDSTNKTSDSNKRTSG